MGQETYIEVKDLSLKIGDKDILKHISFSLQKGKYLAVIGPNGAGKSSLLKSLGMLYKRNLTGEIYLNNKSLFSVRAKEVAKLIAWVHQTGSDSLPYTVREFTKMSRYPWQTTLGYETKKDLEIVENALSMANVTDIAERELNSLSGGERQRALIAAALAQETEILFLDEPTSFLDYQHQVEMMDLIESINKEKGLTIIMVTHDINMALHGADEVLAMKSGTLKWSGTTQELLENGTLRTIFDTEFEIFDNEDQVYPYVVPRGMIV
ncbi:MAG: ABC transporter ATP-binding protein [Synergistaceae bacterium]